MASGLLSALSCSLFLYQPKQAHGIRYDHAQNDSRGRGDGKGRKGPFQALCFLANGQAGGAAGPVQQAEQHGANGRQPRPAIADEQGVKLREVFQLGQRPGRHIAHDENGHNDFICREAQNKRHQDISVQPHQPCKRVEKRRTMGENARIADGNIGQHPDHQACGRGNDYGAAQHKQRAVKNGAHDHLTDLRTAVRRKLQVKGRRHPLEDGL